METRIKPTGVTADRTQRIVTITWSDGTSCDYSFAGLRAVCPCAECRGGHENMGWPADKWLLQHAQDNELTLEGLEPVGSYALMFQWGDGHSTGFYTWEYLYEGCQP